MVNMCENHTFWQWLPLVIILQDSTYQWTFNYLNAQFLLCPQLPPSSNLWTISVNLKNPLRDTVPDCEAGFNGGEEANDDIENITKYDIENVKNMIL